jgi:hypothetical protein
MVTQVQVLELIILAVVVIALVVGFGALLLNQRREFSGQIEQLRSELAAERTARIREREEADREKAELKKQLDLLQRTLIGLRDPNLDAPLAE